MLCSFPSKSPVSERLSNDVAISGARTYMVALMYPLSPYHMQVDRQIHPAFGRTRRRTFVLPSRGLVQSPPRTTRPTPRSLATASQDRTLRYIPPLLPRLIPRYVATVWPLVVHAASLHRAFERDWLFCSRVLTRHVFLLAYHRLTK